MSIALPAPEKNAVSITTRACVALARAIRSLTGEDVKIKWVNDIWLGDRKVAGILTEAVGDENGNICSVIILLSCFQSVWTKADKVHTVA